MSNIICFLPCRSGSERVPLKNTRKFATFEQGLLELKLKQLLNSQLIDSIIVSTDDELVKKISSGLNSNKIQIDDRPKALALSTTSTDELIEYVPSIIKSDDSHILWTHVTSPFISNHLYDDAIERYFSALKLEKFDSLMSVTKIQKFLWNDLGPINYNRSVEKWPRTQTIDSIYEINSGIFLASRSIYLNNMDRIGLKPQLLELDSIQSFDIDWPEDFYLAEKIYSSNEK